MMKPVCLAVILAAGSVVMLPAQTTPYPYHQNEWVGFPGSGNAVAVHNLRPDGQTGPVAARPFSATEVRRTTQTLANGAHVEHADTSGFYRDAQGRMRSESAGRIVIYDPVGRSTYLLNGADKTYRTYAIAPGVGSTSIAVVGDSTWIRDTDTTGPHMPVEPAHPHGSASNYHSEPVSQPVTDDLGTQTVNGISAKGSRITIIIPAGAVGNDRELKVVNERWYSDVLQVLVKTVNSDPRFGVTTYDLINIVQSPPDAALFQPPGDYKPESITHHE